MNQRLLLIISGIALAIIIVISAYFTSSSPNSSSPGNLNQKHLAGEAAAGVAQSQQSGLATSQYPILNQLPVVTSTYRIGSGLSQAHKGDASYFAIYIGSDTASGKAAALSWMSSNGYNPSDYEIIYQGYTP